MPEIVKETMLTPRLYQGLRTAYTIGRFVGAARRSPIMANGQVPGIRRQYDTSYALVLMEQQGPAALHYGKGRNTRADFREALRRAMGER